jgi:hypothetical protein
MITGLIPAGINVLLSNSFYCGPTTLPVHWYAVLWDATVVKPCYCYYCARMLGLGKGVMLRLRPIFCFSLSFSHRHLLPQRHTYGCYMEAMLKPCGCLAVPTAPVLQTESPGIWLPNFFWMLAFAQHLFHQSHVTRWSVCSAFSINSSLPHFF